MLLNVKYRFYKGCDQYLFKLLLGPLQIFWLNNASGPVRIKLFSIRDTREEMLEKLRPRYVIIIIFFFLEAHEKILDQDLFFLKNLILVPGGAIYISAPRPGFSLNGSARRKRQAQDLFTVINSITFFDISLFFICFFFYYSL